MLLNDNLLTLIARRTIEEILGTEINIKYIRP